MKPILFNTPMVQAILDGRKTQTRRVVGDRFTISEYKPKDINGDDAQYKYHIIDNKEEHIFDTSDLSFFIAYGYAKYKKGDTLYVRETFLDDYAIGGQYDDGEAINVIYRADKDDKGTYEAWKPSIHMPKEYARIFLRVTDVRVERLQDMSIEEMHLEGIPDIGVVETADAWVNIWNSTSKDGCSWEDNPYVFLYEFERIEKP